MFAEINNRKILDDLNVKKQLLQKGVSIWVAVCSMQCKLGADDAEYEQHSFESKSIMA